MNDDGPHGAQSLPNALKRGDSLIHSGRFDDCVRLLGAHITDHPDHHWLNFHLGRAYLGLGKHAKARDHFSAAANSSYPFRVGALYESARLAIAEARFDQAKALDDALALPGDVDQRDEAAGQKRYYFDKIHFLKALVHLNRGDHAEADRWLEQTYAFNRAIDERPFAFPWLIDTLGRTNFAGDLANIRYLKQKLLRLGNDPGPFVRQGARSDGPRFPSARDWRHGWSALRPAPYLSEKRTICGRRG
jgi:tetratricopeptide (TPR) repeat protein